MSAAISDNSVGESPETLRVIIPKGLELSRGELGVELQLIDAAGVKQGSEVGSHRATWDDVPGPKSGRGGGPVVAEVEQGPPQVAVESLQPEPVSKVFRARLSGRVTVMDGLLLLFPRTFQVAASVELAAQAVQCIAEYGMIAARG